MPRIRVCTIMSGDTARRREEDEDRERGSERTREPGEGGGIVRDFFRRMGCSSRIVTPFHTPVTHAREPAHKSVYTHSGLIFNPLDSVNACGRPPPHDVDSRPRFRVIGIRLLEFCLSAPSSSLPASFPLFLSLSFSLSCSRQEFTSSRTFQWKRGLCS